MLLGFTVFVTYSKHLHILLSLPNVALARRPRALGALLPVYSGGKAVDFEDPGEDDLMGVGKVEDFTWKGLLDFGTCTECGRCQSQCPAWNTDKPLSPKLLVMTLRDHALAKGPWLTAAEEARDGLDEELRQLASVPLVGSTGYAADAPLTAYNPHGPDAVIDQDVLWSCTTCGACVEQCPVDIEHVDHIVDMRRYQVLMESAFPEEAGIMLSNLEHAADPWGRGASQRLQWAEPLDFDVRVLGADGGTTIPDDVEYLYWVGCAGALDEGAQRTARAVATLLHEAGVEFMVLGDAESCTGDPARRMGHEYLFQMLAQQNVEVLNAAGAKRIVVTCAHCFNTLRNEYPQVGGHYEVIHHTTLLSPARRRPPARPGGPGRQVGHLPRPVLPRPAQPRLRRPARGARRGPRPHPHRDAAQPGAVVLLRRRRGADVDGRGPRHPDQPQPHRRGPRALARPRHGGLPLLRDHAQRRRRPAPDGGHGRATSVEVLDIAEVLLRSVRPDLDDAAPSGAATTPTLRPVRTTMTDTATTATAAASGHFGGAGLDLPSLNLMLEALTDFVDAALSPDLQLELDHEDRCPEDIVRAMSDPMTLGVQLVFIPEQYGGMDGGAFDSYRVCEAMARKDIGLATAVFATFLGSDPIVVGATEEQKQEWLGAIAEQGVVFAYGATEPDAGSDLAAMTTTATPVTDDDGTVTAYRINGRKQWISNGSIADYCTILAATPEGPTWFVVARGTPGLHRRHPGGQARHPAVQHRVPLPRRRRGPGRQPRRHARRARAGAGPAGLRLHPAHGRRVRPRRRLGGPRPRHRLLHPAGAGRRPAQREAGLHAQARSSRTPCASRRPAPSWRTPRTGSTVASATTAR